MPESIGTGGCSTSPLLCGCVLNISEVKETIEVEVKYAGYIARERQAAEKARHLEDIRIAGHFDYLSIQSLSTEARQKLDRIRPATIGQASRIPGISPSDINILLILMGR